MSKNFKKVFGKYQRLNRRLTKEFLYDMMILHLFTGVDLPDQHTIHIIEPLALKCYQHFKLKVSFFLLHLYIIFKNTEHLFVFSL